MFEYQSRFRLSGRRNQGTSKAGIIPPFLLFVGLRLPNANENGELWRTASETSPMLTLRVTCLLPFA